MANVSASNGSPSTGRFSDYNNVLNSNINTVYNKINEVKDKVETIFNDISSNKWNTKFSLGLKGQLENLRLNLENVNELLIYYHNSNLSSSIRSYLDYEEAYKRELNTLSGISPTIKETSTTHNADGTTSSSTTTKTNPRYTEQKGVVEDKKQKMESFLNVIIDIDRNRQKVVYTEPSIGSANSDVKTVPNLQELFTGNLETLNTDINNFDIKKITEDCGSDIVINNIYKEFLSAFNKIKNKMSKLYSVYVSYVSDVDNLEKMFSGESSTFGNNVSLGFNSKMFDHDISTEGANSLVSGNNTYTSSVNMKFSGEDVSGVVVDSSNKANNAGSSSVGSSTSSNVSVDTTVVSEPITTATTTSNPYENMGGNPNEIIELEDPSGNIIYQTRAEIYSGPGAGGVSTEEATANYNNFLNEQNNEVTASEVPVTESNVANSSEIHGDGVKTGEDPFGNEYIENSEDRYTGPGALPRETTGTSSDTSSTQSGQDNATQVPSVNDGGSNVGVPGGGSATVVETPSTGQSQNSGDVYLENDLGTAQTADATVNESTTANVSSGEDPSGSEYVGNSEDMYTGPGALPRENTTTATSTQGGQENVTQVPPVSDGDSNAGVPGGDSATSVETGTSSSTAQTTVTQTSELPPGANPNPQEINTTGPIVNGEYAPPNVETSVETPIDSVPETSQVTVETSTSEVGPGVTPPDYLEKQAHITGEGPLTEYHAGYDKDGNWISAESLKKQAKEEAIARQLGQLDSLNN